jgi:hypothetical protein
MTETNAPQCERCHRALTSAASIARGRGRACQAKVDAVAAAAVDVIPAPALAKALQAIRDHAIVHRTRALYWAVSSNGKQTYEVDARAGSCTCAAGRHGRRCYHVYAAAILAAAGQHEQRRVHTTALAAAA